MSNILLELVDFGESDVCAEAIESRDQADAEPVENGADRVQPAEPGHVFQNQAEGIPSGLAEEGVRQSDLNVCILSDELDALFQIPPPSALMSTKQKNVAS